MSIARHLGLGVVVMCQILTLISSGAVVASTPQRAPCVVGDIDTPTMPACVVRPRNGDLYIPKKYWMHASFNRYGLAPFTVISFGRVYVNRTGHIVIRDVAEMDNAPDEFHHGVVRIVRNGKWGFADPSGGIVVPVEYSCASNYKDSDRDDGPDVCVGCRVELQGEYHTCLGGQWFHMDTPGHLTPLKAR